jgi:hypothetical protein
LRRSQSAVLSRSVRGALNSLRRHARLTLELGLTTNGPVWPVEDACAPVDEVTRQFHYRFLFSGELSPAISGEESGGVLWVEGHGSFMSDRWKRAGSGALKDSLQRNAEIWTVETSTGNLPAGRLIDSPPGRTDSTYATDGVLCSRASSTSLYAHFWRPGDFAHDPTLDWAYGVESRQRSRTGSRRGHTAPQSGGAPECFPGALPFGDGVV